jgi:hypothetical protein
MSNPTSDLNDVIVSAVNARIETAVLEALSGNEFFGKMVTAALHQPVEVAERFDRYSKRKTTFLAHTLESVIQKAVAEATRRLVAERAEMIEAAVREELGKSASEIAKQLVGSVSRAAESPYGIKVDLQFPGRD